MASTNKTTNYELSQYVGSDKPTYLGDYNSDMLKIDAQMKLNATAASTADSKAVTAGNNAATALENAATADGKAVTAGETATSALNKALANETAIAAINEKETWTSISSSASYANCVYRKNKNMIELSIYADGLNQSITNYTALQIGEIPAAYRPDRNLRLPLVVRTVGGNFLDQCYLEVKTTGEINVYNWGVTTSVEALVGYIAFPKV